MPEFTLESMVRFLVDPRSVQQVNNTVNEIKRFAGRALGAIGIGISLKSLNDTVEQMRSINLALESAVGQFGDMDDIQKKILDSSKDVLGNYEDMAKNVSDLVKNNKSLFDVERATRFSEIMTKLTKLSGGSSADASSLISGLASDMRMGKLSSGGLEQLFAKAPQAIKILTDYYGVSERKLRMMAQAGMLKAKDIQKAFTQAGESVDEAFSNLPPKISDVLASTRSELKYFIAETDEMFGITQKFAEFLQKGFGFLMRGLEKLRSGVLFFTQKLGGMQNVLKLIGVVLASFKIAQLISSFNGLLDIFNKIGIKGMFIVGVIALILLAAEDFVSFLQGKDSLIGRVLEKAGINSDEVREKILDLFGRVKEIRKWLESNIPKALSLIGKITSSVGDFVSKFAGNAWTNIKRVAGAVKEFFDGFMNSPAPGAIRNLAKRLGDFFETVVSVSVDTFQKVTEAVGKFLDKFLTFELGESFGRLVAEIVKLFDKLAEIRTDLIEDAGKALDILLDSATKYGMPEALSHLVTALQDLAALALSELTDELNRIKKAFDGVFETLAQSWSDNVSPVIAPLIDTLSEFIDTCTKVQSAIDEKIKPIKDAFAEIFNESLKKSIEMISKAVEGVTEALDGILGFVTHNAKFIGAVFKGDWKEAARLASKGGEDALKIGEGVRKTFFDSLGIGFKGVGEKIDEKTGWFSSAKDKVSGWFNGAAEGLLGMFNISRIPEVAPETVSSLTDSHNTSNQYDMTVNIENNFNGDDRNAQRTTSRAMEKSADDSFGAFGRYIDKVR